MTKGHTIDALARLDAAIVSWPHRGRLPKEQASEKMVREIGARDAEPKPPEADVLEAVRDRLRQALARSPFMQRLRSVFRTEDREKNIDRRDIRLAPWILWQGKPPAIEFPGLLDIVIKQAGQSPRTLRNLIEAWIRDFSPDGTDIAKAGQAIEQLLANTSHARLESWLQAHARFKLFSADHGPDNLAQALLGGGEDVPAILAAAGFVEGARSASSYLRAVQTKLLERLAAMLRDPGATERAQRAFQFLLQDNHLRFDDQRSLLAIRLCQAWFDNGPEPAPEIRNIIRDFLVDHIGDPRIRQDRWSGAEKEAELVRQWLTRASLEVFFGLIADYALDRQWKYRAAFWLAYLKKGVISDAWLALGKQVHAAAHAREKLGTAFGRLDGSADQSVLLLRIGKLVIGEWSHNGKLRAWREQDGPELYKQVYTRSELSKPCLPFPQDPLGGGGNETDTSGLSHFNPEKGYWQRRAASSLARYADVVIEPQEWEPR
jgi:hypothetical protein